MTELLQRAQNLPCRACPSGQPAGSISRAWRRSRLLTFSSSTPLRGAGLGILWNEPLLPPAKGYCCDPLHRAWPRFLYSGAAGRRGQLDLCPGATLEPAFHRGGSVTCTRSKVAASRLGALWPELRAARGRSTRGHAAVQLGPIREPLHAAGEPQAPPLRHPQLQWACGLRTESPLTKGDSQLMTCSSRLSDLRSRIGGPALLR